MYRTYIELLTFHISIHPHRRNTNPSLVIAPTKQQRITIHSVIKWFLRPSKDEKSLKNKNRPDGLDGAMFVQGIAGTGKTKIDSDSLSVLDS